MTKKERTQFLKSARKFGRLLGNLNMAEMDYLDLDPVDVNTQYNWICDFMFDGENIGKLED